MNERSADQTKTKRPAEYAVCSSPPPSSPARARRRPNHASRTATALVAQCRTIILHVAGLRPMHTGNTDFAEQWKGTATPIDEPNDLQTSWWVVPVL